MDTLSKTASSSGLLPAPGCGRPSTRQIVWSIVFGVSLGVGNAVLRYLSVPSALRVVIPAIPLVAGLVYILSMVSDIRRQMDELQMRIYLEAAAVVVCGLFIVLLTYPLLQAARLVGPLEYWVVLLLMVGLGAAGYIAALRRYR